MEDNRRRKEENKLEFLRKFYPNISTTPGGSERLRSGNKNLTDLEHPTESNKIAEFSFSPHSKRKVGGGEHIDTHRLYSPAKRLKLIKQLSFWESGSGYLEGPDSKMADYLDGNNSLGRNDECIKWLGGWDILRRAQLLD